MKTSNIILSALIGSISLFIIVGAIDVRLSELKTSHEQAFDEIPLSPSTPRHPQISKPDDQAIRGVKNYGSSGADRDHASIDTLQLHLDKSDARIQSYVGVLSGAMTDHSSLYAREVSDFQFKKDSTSRLQ